MKILTFSLIALLAALVLGCAPNQQSKSEPSLVREVDASMAVEIAQKAVEKRDGSEELLSQRPFKPWRSDGEWIVSGTVPQPSDGGVTMGGYARVRIEARTGRVLEVVIEE